MTTIDLETLKDKLGEYIRCAAAGETVVVTDAGRIVAEINPPRPVPEGLTPFQEKGVREGWLTPARIRDGSLPPRKPVPGLTFERLMADLERDREDR